MHHLSTCNCLDFLFPDDVEFLWLSRMCIRPVFLQRDGNCCYSGFAWDICNESKPCADTILLSFSLSDYSQTTIFIQGCEQPLVVRFADPKKPRNGDSRYGVLSHELQFTKVVHLLLELECHAFTVPASQAFPSIRLKLLWFFFKCFGMRIVHPMCKHQTHSLCILASCMSNLH